MKIYLRVFFVACLCLIMLYLYSMPTPMIENDIKLFAVSLPLLKFTYYSFRQYENELKNNTSRLNEMKTKE